MRSATMCRGFTLFEMLVVLAIMGLAVALFEAHGTGGSARLGLRAAAEAVANAADQARAQAQSTNRPSVLVVEPGSWRIDGGKPHALDTKVRISPATVHFAPDGTSSGGHVDLRDGSLKADVEIGWLTGAARIGYGS
ncbi:MAG TPA: prepilin-type N-terminal cleavage/methylation domain-containing protein [Stellaceae bacterium]|jgi:general secretion pathway protein H|nr:prepilin-type N-terminal cleavage/methylation domain-containing protein [Stellaceae bacterium]